MPRACRRSAAPTGPLDACGRGTPPRRGVDDAVPRRRARRRAGVPRLAAGAPSPRDLSARDACAPTRARSRSPPAARPRAAATRPGSDRRRGTAARTRPDVHRSQLAAAQSPGAAHRSAGARPVVRPRRRRPGAAAIAVALTGHVEAPGRIGPGGSVHVASPAHRVWAPAVQPLPDLPRDEAVGLLDERLDRPRDDDSVVGRTEHGQERLGQQVDRVRRRRRRPRRRGRGA